MPRTKGGYKTRARRKRTLKRAKGFWGARRKLYAVARETVDRALAFAFIGRKQKSVNFARFGFSESMLLFVHWNSVTASSCTA